VLGSGLANAQVGTDGRTRNAIMFDSTRCIGCRGCERACKRWNNLPGSDSDGELSAATWTMLRTLNESGNRLLCKYQCMHCWDAVCVKVCPVGALRRHDLGFIAYDAEKCIGCGYCGQFCPFAVPRLSGNAVTGQQKMAKCDFCAGRVSQGQSPACVQVCPAGALTFGRRDDLVAAAQIRVATLRGEHPHAQLYGEKELSGLGVLYVLAEHPAAYQLPESPRIPLAATVWQDVFKPLGTAAGTGALLVMGANYVVLRGRHKGEGAHGEEPPAEPARRGANQESDACH
jgi:formate dehydrogenase iron-sulfur subunit